jgi:purine-nucleoside phosphorylase
MELPTPSIQAYPFEESVAAIRAQIPEYLAHPKIGIVCGSGLSTLASRFKNKHEIPYHGLPGFVESTVAGHKSAFAFGNLGDGEGVPVVAMLGRVSTYLTPDESNKLVSNDLMITVPSL